jgi:sulfite exporter TauE/SafE
VEAALVASAALLGLAGAPHCAAMCGAPCAGVVRGCSAARPQAGWLAFLGGRMVGYAMGGALAASAVGVLGALGESAPALRALWTLAHAAAFTLGLWLLFVGRQPAWLKRIGAVPTVSVPVADSGWQRVVGPLRAGGTGALWLALPCGLLQSAVIVAALAERPLGGALAMAAFALTSSLGLVVVPAFALRRTGVLRSLQSTAWMVRLAGAALATASAWALGHGLWQRVVAFCTT